MSLPSFFTNSTFLRLYSKLSTSLAFICFFQLEFFYLNILFEIYSLSLEDVLFFFLQRKWKDLYISHIQVWKYKGLIFLIILSTPVSLLRCLYFIVPINLHTVKEEYYFNLRINTLKTQSEFGHLSWPELCPS